MREALSAMHDGEEGPLTIEATAEHLSGCAACRDFEAGLAPLAALSAATPATPAAPDLATVATARWQRRRESRMYILRWAVGLMGGAELGNAVLQLVLHGTSEAHATHESLSFAIAISLALVCASVRPALAGGYVPIVGTAVALLLLTAGYDVASGRIAFLDELPHIDLLVGCLLMWVLAREHGPGSGSPLRQVPRWRPLLTPLHGRFRVVPSGGRLARVGLGTLIASAIVLTPGTASAHAVLDSSDPAPNATIASAPGAIQLRFSESVSVPTGGVRVYAPDGARADDGDPASQGGRVSVPLAATAEGTYLVSYRVVSADSHPIAGAFTFSVGHATTAPIAPQAADESGLRTAMGISRFVGYAGAALLLGGVAFWLLGWAPSRASHRAALAGAGALALAGLADLALKGPLDAGLGWGGLGDWSALRDVLATTYGRAELTRVVLALLVGVLVAARSRLGGREFAAVGVIGAVLISLTFALAGHAAAGATPAMSVPSWTVHALAMALWVGGLVHLVIDRVWRAPGASTVLRRFSLLALVSVGALTLSGVFQSWRQVRSWGALVETDYGHVLSIKVLLVAVIVVIGYGSRQLLRTAGSPAALGRTVLMEVGGAAVVLALTAGLVATEPAETAYRPSTSSTLSLAGDTVKVSAEPGADREIDLTLTVRDPDGEAVDPDELTATLTLPAAKDRTEIGPLPVDLEDVWTGERSAQVAVPVIGNWTLTLTLRVSDFEEESGTLTIPFR